MNETMVTVTGNVASDVTSRRVGSAEEHLLVTFRVASSERRWDKATETWIDGDRFSASVNCWRRLAEGVMLSLCKGDPVVVTGRLSVREYEVEGARRYMTEIAATAVGPDLARSSARVTRRRLVAVETPEAGTAVDGTEEASAGESGLGAADVSAATGAGGVAASAGESMAADGSVGSPVPGSPGGRTGADGDQEGDGTVTGIGSADRRRSGSARASA